MIKSRDESRKPEIDLRGPDGNAFFLLGSVKTFGRQLGCDQIEIDKIRLEMKSGDYEHLVQTFDKYFGEYVDLIR